MDLSEETLEDIQDIYALLAKENGLQIENLGKALRMLDQSPSESDIKDFQSKFSSETIDFEDFLSIFKACQSSSVDLEEVKSQLDKLEKDSSGQVKTKDLRDLLTNGEEPLDQLEVEELLQDFDKDGLVKIDEFFSAISGKV
jgi:Ca2+-binding EF-hand superfamily protein